MSTLEEAESYAFALGLLQEDRHLSKDVSFGNSANREEYQGHQMAFENAKKAFFDFHSSRDSLTALDLQG